MPLPSSCRQPATRRLALLLITFAALGAGLAACVGDAPQQRDDRSPSALTAPVLAVDDDGDTLRLPHPARRVLSLVPSATDVVIALGAGDRLVGRTRYDTRPEVADLPSVGGGLDPSIEAVVGLRPDLVVVWQGPAHDASARRIAEAGVPVFALRPDDTTLALSAITRLGRLLGRDSAAAAAVAEVRREFARVRRSVAGRPPRSLFYVVNVMPPMTAGPGTFISQIVGLAGGRSVFDDVAQPWPTVSIEELVRRQPEVIVLPVGTDSADSAGRVAALGDLPGWRDLRAVREGRVLTVDVELMNRPGAHMGRAARTLRDLLHPEVADTVRATP